MYNEDLMGYRKGYLDKAVSRRQQKIADIKRMSFKGSGLLVKTNKSLSEKPNTTTWAEFYEEFCNAWNGEEG